MIIAIDYDGTIADTNREKAKWVEADLGLVVSPWQCSRTECVPIIGVEAYERMGDSVYERERTLQTREVPGALDALRTLTKKTTLHIVTARSERRIPFAREWLESNEVLSCFEEIHTSDGSTKAAVCSNLGADILIDDDVRHLRDVDVEGLTRILLHVGRIDKPDCGPGITFCDCWESILQTIDKRG